MVFALFGATAPGGSIIGAVFAGLFSLAWWYVVSSYTSLQALTEMP